MGEPGVRVVGAGSPSVNGWYRRMEDDAVPPAGWLRRRGRRRREHWYDIWYKYAVKDSPGWYHSVGNSFIYWDSSIYRWFMRDEDGDNLYHTWYDARGTAPDFPPRDGWRYFHGHLPAPTLPVVVDADGRTV